MNIITLEMEAFGPFAKPCTIDFARTVAGGLFLIQGPTGAGKTSILDAICYALYGESSGSERLAISLRSHHAPEDQATRVRLVFGSGGKTYQVRRWMAGRKSTTPNEKAVLEELGVLETLVLADKRTEVAQRITNLIRLDEQQFRQVIVLPQGRFRDFLVAKSQERESILKSLFDTARLADLVDRIVLRRRKIEDAATSLRQEAQFLRTNLNLSIEADPAIRLQELEQRLLLLDQQFQQFHSQTSAARLLLEQGKGQAILLANWKAAQIALAALEENKPDGQRLRLARAESLRTVGHLPSSVSRLESDLKGQIAIINELDHNLALHHSDLEKLLRRVAAAEADYIQVPQIRERLATRQAQRAEIENLEQLERTAQDTTQLINLAEKARVISDGIRAEQQAKLTEIRRERLSLQEWTDLPHSVELLQRDLIETAALLGEIQQVRVDSHTASETLAQLGQEIQHSERQANSRTEERLVLQQSLQRNVAASLATTLEEGKACPVCGSIHHPAPATAVASTEQAEKLHDLEQEIAALLSQKQEAAIKQAVARESKDQLEKSEVRLSQAVAAHRQHLSELAATIVNSSEVPVGELAFIPTVPPEFSEFLAQLVQTISTDQPEAVAALAESCQDLLRTSQAAQRSASQLDRQISSLEENLANLNEKLHQEVAQLAVLTERQASQQAQLMARRKSLALAFDLDLEQLPRGEELDRILAAEERRIAAIEAEWDLSRREQASLEKLISAADSRKQELIRQCQVQRADLDQVRAEWETAVRVRGFASAADAVAAMLPEVEIEAIRQTIAIWDSEHLLAVRRLAELTESSATIIPPNLPLLESSLAEAERTEAELERTRALANHERDQISAVIDRLDALATELAQVETKLASVSSLCRLLQGQDSEAGYVNLQRYALSVYLDEILTYANRHLGDMSRSRYELVRQDIAGGKSKTGGLELQILDSYTGSQRGTESLSGGESFIAALSLALGLSSVVHAQAGGVRIDTLFVDEGFGSLDEEALQDAMTVLGRLHERGRTVGIISHVRELQERIPLQLVVSRSNSGSSADWNDRFSAIPDS